MWREIPTLIGSISTKFIHDDLRSSFFCSGLFFFCWTGRRVLAGSGSSFYRPGDGELKASSDECAVCVVFVKSSFYAGQKKGCPVAEVLDEPYSAKPAHRSCRTCLPGYIGWRLEPCPSYVAWRAGMAILR
jgi:hypothetical protein